jgi:hypothetical protein
MTPNNAINTDVQKRRFALLCTPVMANKAAIQTQGENHE